MQPRIDSAPSPIQTGISPQSQGGVAPDIGQFRGQDVVHQPDPLSEIADAAEEITFAASEKVESHLTERKVTTKSLTKTHAVELAEMYLQAMHDLGNPDKLKQFAEELRNLGKPNQEQILQHAKRNFQDLSHQHAALSFSRDLLTEEGADPDLLAALNEAIETLEETHGPEIRAGVNVTSVAIAHAESGLAGVQELRNFYRETVIGFDNVVEAYSSILKQHGGGERFDQALDFLIRATGNDLQSQGPSVAPTRLKTVVDDLYQVQVLGNVHRALTGLIGKAKSGYGGQEDPKAVFETMQQILSLTQNRYCRPDQITAIAKSLGMESSEAKIYFLTGLKEQVRLLPLKIYPSPEHREKLLETIQETLDQAINDEESGL